MYICDSSPAPLQIYIYIYIYIRRGAGEESQHFGEALPTCAIFARNTKIATFFYNIRPEIGDFCARAVVSA